MSETDEIIGSAEPMESEMLSDNLQLIVGNREYIYSHRELFLSPVPVSVCGIKGPIAIGTLLKLWEQGNGWLCAKCDECGGRCLRIFICRKSDDRDDVRQLSMLPLRGKQATCEDRQLYR